MSEELHDIEPAIRKMLINKAPEITKICIDKALEGHTPEIKICMNRLLPPYMSIQKRERIPKLKGRTISEQLTNLMEKYAEGAYRDNHVKMFISIIEKKVEALNQDDLRFQLGEIKNMLGMKK